MEFDLIMAQVVSVNLEKHTVTVTAQHDGLIVPDIPIDNSIHSQFIPVQGQLVMIMRMLTSADWRIVNYFGSESLDLQASRPLQPGEIMSRGIGGGYFYADKAGNVILSDKTMSNMIQMLVNTRINMMGDSLVVRVNGVGSITMKPIGTDSTVNAIEIVKTDATNTPVAKISLQNDTIKVEGVKVELGPIPTAGCVVSLSGVVGEYSFDSLGRPVPGSSTVKGSL